jgi:hypothetical protein
MTVLICVHAFEIFLQVLWPKRSDFSIYTYPIIVLIPKVNRQVPVTTVYHLVTQLYLYLY